MRVTMNMISKQYSRSLNKNLGDLQDAYNKATTFRKFDKTSEDPFDAAVAYRLRRESAENQTYQDSLSDMDNQFSTAQSAMMSIHNIVSSAGSGDCIQGITGTMSPSDRKIIADKLRKYQEAIVAPTNTKFGDKYIFGGSDMSQPPMTVDNGHLYYRGVDVNTGDLLNGPTVNMNGSVFQFGQDQTEFGGYKLVIAAGASGSATTANVNTATKEITVTADLGKVVTNKDFSDALQKLSPVTVGGTKFDFSKVTVSGDLNTPIKDAMSSSNAITSVGTDGLKKLAGEQCLVDLGMGLKLNPDNATINPQSAFDQSIPAIAYMGYGTDPDTGLSSNLYTLMGKIADQLDSSSFSIDSIKPYLDEFSKRGNALMSEITKSGTKSTFLSATKTNLESMGDAVVDKDQNVEYLDVETAIMNQYTQQFSYNAALAMGTKIMSKTLLDYMF